MGDKPLSEIQVEATVLLGEADETIKEMSENLLGMIPKERKVWAAKVIGNLVSLSIQYGRVKVNHEKSLSNG